MVKKVSAADMSKAAKKPGTAVVAWEQEMAAAASNQAAAEKPWGSFKSVSTQGGIMKIDDEPVEDNAIRVVVLAAIHENQYYDKPYNPGVMEVPRCYSYSDPLADNLEEAVANMVPHANAEEPQGADADSPQGVEGGSCGECWANIMGTADIGRGKACKNIRRLALITEDALESAEAMADAEVRFLKVPVMSTKLWGSYVRKLSDEMKRTPYGVVTTIKLVDDPKSQFLVTFEFEELVNFDQKLWDTMHKKIADVVPSLIAPYPSQDELAAAQQEKAAASSKGKRPPGKEPPKKGPKKAAGKKF